MQSIPYTLWADLLGKPWRADARGPDAYDCVGLLLEIERRLGYTLPDYASESHALLAAMAAWERVTDPQPGDGILIYSAHPRWHVAVVCSPNMMLHSREGLGVAIERYSGFPWQSQIEGFYRWRLS